MSACAELRRRTLRSYGAFLISGTSLALHFGCWVRALRVAQSSGVTSIRMLRSVDTA